MSRELHVTTWEIHEGNFLYSCCYVWWTQGQVKRTCTCVIRSTGVTSEGEVADLMPAPPRHTLHDISWNFMMYATDYMIFHGISLKYRVSTGKFLARVSVCLQYNCQAIPPRARRAVTGAQCRGGGEGTTRTLAFHFQMPHSIIAIPMPLPANQMCAWWIGTWAHVVWHGVKTGRVLGGVSGRGVIPHSSRQLCGAARLSVSGTR